MRLQVPAHSTHVCDLLAISCLDGAFAVTEGKALPTELRDQDEQLRTQIEFDDKNTEGA